MATQNEILFCGSTQIVVGLSAIVKVAPTAFSYGYNMKISGGSGTLEIHPGLYGGYSLSGAGATGWGLGYQIGSTESVTLDGPATFYLCAKTATMTASVLLGRTAGVSFV